MPRKNVIPTTQIATNQSLAASFNSTAVPIQWEDNICFECVWTTANIVGTLKVQGSLTGTNYADLRDSGGNVIQFSIASANDVGIFDLNQLSYAYVRVVFTRTSGTSGTINVYVGGKMI